MIRAAPEPAYVLHQWAWSETSLIADLFTRGHGRLAIVAKGAKRPYSQLRSVLLPFQRIAVTLGRPKADAAVQRVRADDGGEILTLRAAEFVGGVPPLPSHRLFAGFYLNELLMKLLARQDPHVALFDAYADALGALAVADAGDGEAALRAFELQLLRESGVLPELDRCTSTQEPLVARRPYALRPDSGLVAAGVDEMAPAAEDWLAIDAALASGDGAALREASAAVLPALKAQLRGVLHYHLGSPNLRTRQAMIELRRLLGTEPESLLR